MLKEFVEIYFNLFSEKNIEQIADLLSENITLCYWEINVSGKDKHRYYSMPNGAIPDGPAGFRDIVENVIVDISGQNLAINSRGHTGNDGPPEATHPDIDASCYSNFSY